MKKTLQSQKIGFLGCGNMAQAIISALYDNGYVNLSAFDLDNKKLESVNGKAAPVSNAQALVDGAKYIFIAVKPKDIETAVKDLDFSAGKIPVSIMAGVPLKKIMRLTNASKAVRVMPNLNALVKLSHNAYCQNGLKSDEIEEVEAILSTFGNAAKTDEGILDAITGLSGSGPAFVFSFFKGLILGAKIEGLDINSAIEAAGMTVAGSIGTLLHSVFCEKPKDYSEAIAKIDKKIADVCSPGGTTIEGIERLNEKNFEETVAEAVIKAAEKAKLLSGNNR